MVNGSDNAHRRILVIDDNPAIHSDFRKILGAGLAGELALQDAKAALFGTAVNPTAAAAFEIDIASQGQEGAALVERARNEQRPYALAFVDMRMPPGWDGVETTAKIWELDPEVQIVICTAYSDYSWEEMLQKLGRSHRLFILKKPFDNIEVLQLANALTDKWRLSRDVNIRLQELETRVAVLTQQLHSAAANNP